MTELQVIEIMKRRYVTRRELQMWLGRPDASCRAWVRDLRERYPIMSSCRTLGYKIATSRADLEGVREAMAENRAKARSLYAGTKALSAFVAQYDNGGYEQLTLTF